MDRINLYYPKTFTSIGNWDFKVIQKLDWLMDISKLVSNRMILALQLNKLRRTISLLKIFNWKGDILVWGKQTNCATKWAPLELVLLSSPPRKLELSQNFWALVHKMQTGILHKLFQNSHESTKSTREYSRNHPKFWLGNKSIINDCKALSICWGMSILISGFR